MQPSSIDTSCRGNCALGDSPRILLVRLSAIGDCVLTLPLATAIKRNCPGAHLTWVVDCAASQLLEHHPAVDTVIRLQKGFLKRPRELYALRRRLRSQRFDFAIDPQGLFKSGFLTLLSGASRRVGFDACGTREFASYFYTDRRHPLAEHLVERQLELLETFGLDATAGHADETLPVDFGWDSAWSHGPRLSEGSFAALNPGAGWESKRWPVDRYALLADELYRSLGLRSIVFWGSPRELQLAKTITMLAPRSTELAAATDLPSLARWLSEAAIFVGSDTGPMHLAASIGTPTVAMFGTSLASRSGPHGPEHRSLQKRYDGGSARYRRNTTNAAMQAIDVRSVCDVALEVLERQGFQALSATRSLRRAA